MYELPQPTWRRLYESPLPSVDAPGVGIKKRTESPKGEPGRKAAGVGQARGTAHAPCRQRDQWDLTLPSRLTREWE